MTPAAEPERTFGHLALLIAAMLPSWPLNAWILAKLWAWFLVPLGVPAVGMAHGYGIWVLLGFLWTRPADLRAATDAELLAKAYAAPLIALAMGAVLQWVAFR